MPAESLPTSNLRLAHSLNGATWQHCCPLAANQQHQTAHEMPSTLSDDILKKMRKSVTKQGSPQSVSEYYGVSCPHQELKEDLRQQHSKLLVALGDHLEKVGRTLSAYAVVENDASNAAKVSQPGIMQALRCTLLSLIPDLGDDLESRAAAAAAASSMYNSQFGSVQGYLNISKHEIARHENGANALNKYVGAAGHDRNVDSIRMQAPLRKSANREYAVNAVYDSTSTDEGTIVENKGPQVNFLSSRQDSSNRNDYSITQARPSSDRVSQRSKKSEDHYGESESSKWKAWRTARVSEAMMRQGPQPSNAFKNEESDGSVVNPSKPLKNHILQVSEWLVALVIILYSVVLALSVDIDWEGWVHVEYAFTIFFIFELVFKFYIFGLKTFFLGPDWCWNGFDLLVALIAVADSMLSLMYSGDDQNVNRLSNLTIVKVIRLGRLARLIRLLRFSFFKELKAMIRGVVSGLQVLLWAVVLFFAFIYILAITLRQLLGPAFEDSEIEPREQLKKSFESVPASVNTLFMCFTDGCDASDGTPLQVHLYQDYGLIGVILCMFIMLFVTIGLFNLIMATFVDNVLEKGRQDKLDKRARERVKLEAQLRTVVMKFAMKGSSREFPSIATENLVTILSGCLNSCWRAVSRLSRQETIEQPLAGADSGITIGRHQFRALLKTPEMQDTLYQLDIETSSRDELFDVLDADMSGELEFDELIVGLMSLRGPAEKKDIIGSLLCIRATQQLLKEAVEQSTAQTGMMIHELRSSVEEVVARLEAMRIETALTIPSKVIFGSQPSGSRRRSREREKI